MGAARGANRLVWHILALASLVVLSTFCLRPANDERGTLMGPLPQDGAMVYDWSPAVVADDAGSPQVATVGHTRFPPAVERWRGISQDAAQTVKRVTGVELEEDVL